MTHMSITTRSKHPADVRMVFINNEQSPQNRLSVVSCCGGGCGCWCCDCFLSFFYFDFLSRGFFPFLPPLSILMISVSARPLLLCFLLLLLSWLLFGGHVLLFSTSFLYYSPKYLSCLSVCLSCWYQTRVAALKTIRHDTPRQSYLPSSTRGHYCQLLSVVPKNSNPTIYTVTRRFNLRNRRRRIAWNASGK